MDRRSLLLALSSGAILQATETPSGVTDGFVNGRYWKAAEPFYRTMAVRMMHDMQIMIGQILSAIDIKEAKRLAAGLEDIFVPNNASYQELSDKIDLFYKDPANLPIPVINLYMIAVKAMNGASSRDTEKELDESRKDAQSSPSSKQ